MTEAYDLDDEPQVDPGRRRLNGHAPNVDDPTLVQWARFRDQFAERMDAGFWTLEDLEGRIASRTAFFFPGRNAALVGQIDVFPGGERAFRILWSVGDQTEAAVILPGVEALARMMGCTSMLIEGSELSAGASAGYEPWSVTLHKGL